MNAPHNLLDVMHNLSTRRRIIGSICVVADALFGTAQWMPSGADTTVVDTALRTASVSAATSAFDYFPSAYINQATQAEEHIQAF